MISYIVMIKLINHKEIDPYHSIGNIFGRPFSGSPATTHRILAPRCRLLIQVVMKPLFDTTMIYIFILTMKSTHFTQLVAYLRALLLLSNIAMRAGRFWRFICFPPYAYTAHIEPRCLDC